MQRDKCNRRIDLSFAGQHVARPVTLTHKFRRNGLGAVVPALLLSSLPAFAATPLQYERGDILFEDSFDSLANWKVEQMEGGTTVIRDGRMEIDDAKGCTVWFRERMEGPLIIEYDVTMIQAGGPNDNTRDLNCFWMAIDPNYPTDIFKNDQRTGKFSDYHYLRLYYVGYGGHANTKTRFRRYDGLSNRPLLPQHDLNRPEFMIPPNETMRIQIIVIGNRTQYLRDGDVVFDFYDPQPYGQGWFAYRTVSNRMTVENFKVTRVAPRNPVDATPALMPLGPYPGGYRIGQISTGTAPAMHAYIDICPESPDGKRVVYFEFEDASKKWGRVVVANRDGSEAKYVTERIRGHEHDGARQQWLDDARVLYGLEDEEASVIVNVDSGATQTVAGQIGMVSEIHGLGLGHNNYPSSKYKGDARKPPEVYLMDLESGSTRTLLNKTEMIPLHPRRSIIESDRWRDIGVFKHPKWSPDGKRFFWVFMIEDKANGGKIVKSALTAQTDGSGIRYAAEVGQHPMWVSNDSLLSYVRNEGFHHYDNPSAQVVMEQPIDGSAGEPLIENALGIHGSLSPDKRSFVSDIFDWPEKGSHALLLYSVETGEYRVLARMRAEEGDHGHDMHPHPSWSRDGNRVYFNGSDTGQRRLYAVDLEHFEF